LQQEKTTFFTKTKKSRQKKLLRTKNKNFRKRFSCSNRQRRPLHTRASFSPRTAAPVIFHTENQVFIFNFKQKKPAVKTTGFLIIKNHPRNKLSYHKKTSISQSTAGMDACAHRSEKSARISRSKENTGSIFLTDLP